MLLFLPPSEAKAVGGALPALRGHLRQDLLGRARRRVLTEVAALARRDPAAAAAALKIPAGAVQEATTWNRHVLVGPTCPALERYTGVVYAAFDPASLTPAQHAAALRSVRVFSGGFGYLRGDEPVPAYRIPAAARLPEAGGLTRFWKPVLRDLVATDIGGQLVVDVRSSDYLALWPVPPPLREQVLAVRVLTRRRTAHGVAESVVSYNSKHLKGVLARALVRSATRGQLDDVGRVASVVESLGYEARIQTLPGGQPAMDVVEDLVV